MHEYSPKDILIVKLECVGTVRILRFNHEDWRNEVKFVKDIQWKWGTLSLSYPSKIGGPSAGRYVRRGIASSNFNKTILC
jgi:hypothetical protein